MQHTPHPSASYPSSPVQSHLIWENRISQNHKKLLESHGFHPVLWSLYFSPNLTPLLHSYLPYTLITVLDKVATSEDVGFHFWYIPTTNLKNTGLSICRPEMKSLTATSVGPIQLIEGLFFCLIIVGRYECSARERIIVQILLAKNQFNMISLAVILEGQTQSLFWDQWYLPIKDLTCRHLIKYS